MVVASALWHRRLFSIGNYSLRVFDHSYHLPVRCNLAVKDHDFNYGSADIVEKWTWYLAAALFVLCIIATTVVSSSSAGNIELLSQ